MQTLKAIGRISSEFSAPSDPLIMKQSPSRIRVFDEYADGLYKLEGSDYLDIYYEFHLSDGYELKCHNYYGKYKGVFATRSPFRPNPLAHCTVRLLEIIGKELLVEGLDAVDGSPLLDIKPADTSLYKEGIIQRQQDIQNPRKEVIRNIFSDDLESLLFKAAQMHGHYCTGLALGIMAGVMAMKELQADSDGLEGLMAVVETNNCFSDGIQFVTGCSFGNNSMVFKDIGKTAFSLAQRNGRAIRLVQKSGARQYIQQAGDAFEEHYRQVVGEQKRSNHHIEGFKVEGFRKAFRLIHLDASMIFSMQEVKAVLPPYAPSYPSLICSHCGEEVMESRCIKDGDKTYCLSCQHKGTWGQLDGHGIHYSD